jgi:creatinine amidohydrolase
MTPGAVRERLQERPGLVVPVGTTEQHGPHLPLGCDTIIVEHLADDLSAEFGILRAPTVGYGVHAPTHAFPGGASLRRRTLHRVMNELTDEATVQVIDVFGLDFGPLLERPGSPIQGGELDTSLLLYLAPETVRMDLAQDFAVTPDMVNRFRPGHSRRLPQGSPGSVGFPSLASAQKGELLYRFIVDRIRSCLT